MLFDTHTPSLPFLSLSLSLVHTSIMEPDEDPWSLLGVSRDAAAVEIKFAFRKLALEYHPDKQVTEQDKEAANAIFSKLSAAYETVSDPNKAKEWKQDEEKRKQAAATPSNKSVPPATRPRGTPAAERQAQPPKGGRPAQGGAKSAAAAAASANQQQITPHRLAGKGTEQARPRQAAASSGAMVPVAQQQQKQQQVRSRQHHHQGGGGPVVKSQNQPNRSAADNNPMMYYPKPGEAKAPRVVLTADPTAGRNSTVKFYRDPFEVFETVMTEEFGKDYKKKDAWVKSTGAPNLASINPFARRSENSRREFKKLDVDGDKSLSRTELAKYMATHADLWTNLGCSLDLPVYKCIDIATDVAILLALKQIDQYGRTAIPTRDLTEAEFKYFHQNYVLNEKGAQEFFLRTMFAAFDINKDGVLSARELDRFLDIFYRARDTFKGTMQLPDRKTLNQTVRHRCDKNKDGVLQFKEVKDLLVVAAVVTADNRDH